MEKTHKYHVLLNLKSLGDTPVLNIKPRNGSKKCKIPYPFSSFDELNIPIHVNKELIEDSQDLEYFLDFKNSYNGEWKRYGENFFGGELGKVLRDFTVAIDEELIGSLNGKNTLINKAFSFKSEGGWGNEKISSRCGNPKKGRRAIIPDNNKVVSI